MNTTFDELFDFLPRTKNKAKEGLNKGLYPFYTSSPTLNKYTNNFDYEGNCLIIGTGGSPSVHYSSGKFSASSDCIIVTSKKNIEINLKYYYFYLFENLHLLEVGFRGAGLRHISKNFISRIKVPFPSIEEQNNVVNTLNYIDIVIDKRQLLINLLDDFLKSYYYYKFIFNEDNNSWETLQLQDLTPHRKSMRTGPFGSNLKHNNFLEKGEVYVIGIDNVVQNKFVCDTLRYISIEKYKELGAYRVFPKDVLITIMGTIGKSAVVPEDIPLSISTKHLAAITLVQAKVNPYFISYSFYTNPFIIQQLNNSKRGSLMDGLNLGIIRKIKVQVPPIEYQNQFELVMKNTMSLKSKYQKQLDEIKSFYSSIFTLLFSDGIDKINITLANNVTFDFLSVIQDLNIDNFSFNVFMEKYDEISNNSIFDEIKTKIIESNSQLMDDDFTIYNFIKTHIVSLLESNPAYLHQQFDIDKKRIILKVNHEINTLEN